MVWSGNARYKDKKRINKCLKFASKLIEHKPLKDFDSHGMILCKKIFKKILKDKEHPLHTQLQFSPKSGRIIHPKARTV